MRRRPRRPYCSAHSIGAPSRPTAIVASSLGWRVSCESASRSALAATCRSRCTHRPATSDGRAAVLTPTTRSRSPSPLMSSPHIVSRESNTTRHGRQSTSRTCRVAEHPWRGRWSVVVIGGACQQCQWCCSSACARALGDSRCRSLSHLTVTAVGIVGEATRCSARCTHTHVARVGG